MKNAYKYASYFFLIALVLPLTVQAESIYKKKYNSIKLEKIDEELTAGEPVDHPALLEEAKLYNMLASLRFDKKSLILKDVENIRLFGDKDLKLLTPHFLTALRKATPEQMVSFAYVKVGRNWKVMRDDRLITGKMFVRGGELYVSFTKLNAKIFGDYQRAGSERILQRAKDLRVSLDAKGGQRLLNGKFIALKFNHNYHADLMRLAADERALKAAKKAEQVNDEIPLPRSTSTTAQNDVPLPASRRTAPAASAPASGDAKLRLETLEDLKNKKLISEREYKRKRKEILDSL